jgi:hydrogenase/urease accessory protein HupE
MLRHLRAAAAMAAAIVLWIALCPTLAEAHLNSTGLGPIYDGALHLLLSPEDLVPAFALALLAGLRGARHGRVALFVLPAAWFIGGLAGTLVGHGNGTAVAVVSFLLLGVLIAADARLSLALLTTITMSLGLVHGFVNGAGMGQLAVGAQALLGLGVVLFVLTALVVALVVQLRQPWSRIAVRVLGSWIAASGLLMLGWAMRATR